MKSLLVLSLFVLAARAESFHGPHRSPAPFTMCYAEPMLKGPCISMTTSHPDLSKCQFDNRIASINQTGFWIYYENKNYNAIPGKVVFAFGRNVSFTLPPGYRNMISSAHLLTARLDVSNHAIVFFEGSYLTQQSHTWLTSVASFGNLVGKLYSILLVGKDPWTLYTGETFTGSHMCVYPNVELPVTTLKTKYSLGIYANITMLGFQTNVIKSVKKGCYSKKHFQSPKIHLDGHDENGGWGKLM